MHITEQEAAAIYARACLAWYGSRAPAVVAERIKHLRRKADLKGVRAWSRVASELPKVRRRRGPRVVNSKSY